MSNRNRPNVEPIRRLFKEGFWIIFGQAMAVLGSLVGVRLLTELLDPAANGELALGMTLATLFNQTILGPLGGGVTRFYASAQEQGDLVGYMLATRRLLFSATGIIALVSLATVTGLLIAGRTEWISIAAASFIFAVLSGYNSILNGLQNAARQRSVVALHQGMESWSRNLIAAGMMVWLGSSSSVAMAGHAGAVGLVLASQYVFFRNTIGEETGVKKEGDWRGKIWEYSWPFASWGIFSWAQQSSDRWALSLFGTTHDVGLYTVLCQLGYYPISLVTGIAMQLLAPIFFQRAGDGSDSRRNAIVNNLSWRLTWIALGVTCVAFCAALSFHGWIFQILVATQYGAISHLLPWVLLAGGLFSAGQSLALGLMSQIKTRTMVVVKIVTALLGVAFNFVGAYIHGIEGVVFACNLFSVAYLLWMAIIARRTTDEVRS